MTKARPAPSGEMKLRSLAEMEMFDRDDITRVRILGINALGILHRHKGDLLAILRNGGSVELLLLDPQSPGFRKQRDAEEKRGGRLANRLCTELEASMATLRDVVHLMLQEHGVDIATLRERLAIRFATSRPRRSLLFVETLSDRAMLSVDLPAGPPPPDREVKGVYVRIGANDEHPEYDRCGKAFLAAWKQADPVPLETLLEGMLIVSPRKADVPRLYRQAVDLHGRRRLDEASDLYDSVLRLERPKRSIEEQFALAQRFMPRVFTTRSEPFELKDIVVVIHPDESRRLIGYHMIWEDDIDYLADNDPADHEVVWVQYSKELTVEGAWSYWHNTILSTAKSAPHANANGGRVAVYVQWGKHGSLLEGWEEKIGIDERLSDYRDYVPLEFSRLCKGRYKADVPYGDRWPRQFDGELADFIGFQTEIDVLEKLAEHRMVAVGRYANALMARWFLPYNFRPKHDWPHEDARVPGPAEPLV